MSVKPRLVCPPDYSILSLRFTECKKIGVVKGTTTMFAFDLSKFFIPLTNFSERKFTIKSGKTQKLDISDIAVYWDLAEQYNFVYTDAAVGNLTSHQFTVYDEYGVNVLGSMSFQVDSSVTGYTTFATAFASELASTTSLAALITATYGPALSEVTVTAKTKGVKYRYLLEYDTATLDYQHPGTLIGKFQKYPEGRVRAIFLYADFERVDKLTCSCGCCTDASGDLLSNVKNFKWVWDSEYTRKQYTSYFTKIYTNADAADPAQQNPGGTQTFQWFNTPGGEAVPYHLEVGDLVTTNLAANSPYAYVTDIDGYNITIDKQGLGSGLNTDILVKKYAPAPIEWKVGGEMLFISGGQDVYDADRLYTETIWINNTQSYDIPFVAIIVS